MKAAGCWILLCGALLAHGCGKRAEMTPPEPPVEQPPRGVVVLLADPDGGVGQVEVANAAGSRTLDKANQGVEVAEASTAPGQPRDWSEKEIADVFGPALDAQPASPEHFLLHFRTGTVLTDESQAMLDRIVEAVRKRNAVDVSVIGHSDTSGDERINLRVSTDRARAVADLLLAAGVAPEILEVTSHGESDLLVKTGDNVVEPRNRRVEVIVR